MALYIGDRLISPAEQKLALVGIALLGAGVVGLANLEQSPPEPASCTYVVQPGDRLFDIAGGNMTLTNYLVEAQKSTLQGKELPSGPEIFPGNVLYLGEAACGQLQALGRPTRAQTDYPS